MKIVIKWTHVYIKPGRQRVQALADILHSRYVITAMQPVHRLQTRPIVQNYAAPPAILPSYIWLCAVVRACGRGQTDRQTHVTTVHFTSSTTHTKCKCSWINKCKNFKCSPKVVESLWGYHSRIFNKLCDHCAVKPTVSRVNYKLPHCYPPA